MDTHSEMEVKSHQQPNYLIVFIVLGLITATMTGIELLAVPITTYVKNTVFVLLSVTKATLVAMYYMHLKFDSYIYTIFFSVPVLLILVFVFILVL